MQIIFSASSYKPWWMCACSAWCHSWCCDEPVAAAMLIAILRVTVFSITSTPSSLSGSSCHLCPAVSAFAFVGLTVCLRAALSKTAGIKPAYFTENFGRWAGTIQISRMIYVLLPQKLSATTVYVPGNACRLHNYLPDEFIVASCLSALNGRVIQHC